MDGWLAGRRLPYVGRGSSCDMPGAESVPPRGLPFAARSGCTSSPCIGPPPACQHTNTQRTRRREHSRSGRSPSWRQTGSVIVAIVARPQGHLSKRLSGQITHRSCPRCQDAPLAPFCAPRALPPLPPRSSCRHHTSLRKHHHTFRLGHINQ